MKWGTLRFEDNNNSTDNQERSRPEFIGKYRSSTINGNQEHYFPISIRNKRRCVTFGIVLTFFLALIGSICAVILLRVYVTTTSSEYGSYIIAAANTTVIMFFNNIYGIIAEKLNKWENYKTDTEYENNHCTFFCVHKR